MLKLLLQLLHQELFKSELTEVRVAVAVKLFFVCGLQLNSKPNLHSQFRRRKEVDSPRKWSVHVGASRPHCVCLQKM